MFSDSEIKFIIARIIDNANYNLEELNKNKEDAFFRGKKLAYYEVLDTIKNQLIINDQNLKEFGLDINLDSKYI